MFSDRTNWTLQSNTITVLLDSLKKKDARIIDLTESNPTRCFDFPDGKILAALQKEENISYRPSALGNLAAREAIARYYQQQGYKISSEQILLTSSTSEAYSFLFRLLANPGETVLFPRPSYPLFEYLMGLNDVQAEGYALNYRDRWQLESGELKAEGHPKAVIVVNPNNPTGSYFSAEEMKIMNAFCHREKSAIIADEVFFDYCFDEKNTHQSFAGNTENLTFTLGGISKTLALPQMKISWIVATGPKAAVKNALERLEVIADTYLSVNTPSQNALPEWLQLRKEIQGKILGRLRNNRRVLSQKAQVLNADGGWYAVVKLPPAIAEEEFVLKLLQEQHVFVHPGYFFDFIDEPFLVLSLLPAEKDFQEGVEKILKQISQK